MGSSGKKRTTMAKLARENRLRERRQNKEAKREARRYASTEQEGADGDAPDAQLADVEAEQSDPRVKEVALRRLHDSSDEELAVFEASLQDGAHEAGASEQEVTVAQRDHPEHGA